MAGGAVSVPLRMGCFELPHRMVVGFLRVSVLERENHVEAVSVLWPSLTEHHFHLVLLVGTVTSPHLCSEGGSRDTPLGRGSVSHVVTRTREVAELCLAVFGNALCHGAQLNVGVFI